MTYLQLKTTRKQIKKKKKTNQKKRPNTITHVLLVLYYR